MKMTPSHQYDTQASSISEEQGMSGSYLNPSWQLYLLRRSMSRSILFIAFIVVSLHVEAQSVGISADGAAPHASALLDVNVAALAANNKKGLLVPRMNTSEREAIADPAQGLLVFDITLNEFWFHDGTAWMAVAATSTIWSVTGNAGTGATDFIGTNAGSTTLEFRANNERVGYTADGVSRVSFGHLAMPLATGVNNTAFGKNALQNLGTGTNNTAIGTNALNALTTGVSNTAVGYHALRYATGSRNTALGYNAMEQNTTGSDNTAIGLSASRYNLIGSRNTAVGSGALENNTSSDNTAVGYQALQSNTTGESNSAMGSRCMANQTVGSRNTAMGYLAMELNVSGIRNCAIGASASRNNLTGSYNVAFGKDALRSNLSSYNTASGMTSAFSVTTGSYNTALGYFTLIAVTTGNYNTGIGPFAGPEGNYTNTTAIGNAATPTANNRITIGSVANNNLTGGHGTWQNFSDARFKKNVRSDVPGLDLILRLRPVTYLLDAEAIEKRTGSWQRMDTMTTGDLRATYMQRLAEVTSDRQTGFIAQEVEAAVEAIGYPFDGVHHPADDADHYTLGYEQFTLPLINAVKEQQMQIEEMEALNARLHQRVQELIELRAERTAKP